jgi:histone H3/H4
MAKAKSKAKAAPKAAKEVLLVGSKVRGLIKDADCNTAGDAVEGLNEWVYWLIAQATTRAKANGRKTVRAHDFMVPMG